MKTTLFLFITLISLSTLVRAEPSKEDLLAKDAEVQSTLKAFDNAETKAFTEYERARKTACDAAVVRLQARLDAATKAGKLDTALALRDLIGKFKPTTQPTTKSDALFIPWEIAIGTWNESNGNTLTVTPDGKFVSSARSHGNGTWTMTPSTLVMTWKSGRIDTFTVRETDGISGENSSGHKVTITKKMK